MDRFARILAGDAENSLPRPLKKFIFSLCMEKVGGMEGGLRRVLEGCVNAPAFSTLSMPRAGGEEGG